MRVFFIIVLVLALCLAIALIAYAVTQIVRSKKNGKKSAAFEKSVGKKLKRLADKNGWQLIHGFELTLPSDGKKLYIAYLLLADKYCYYVDCLYLEGALTGKPDTMFWQHYDTDGKKTSCMNFFGRALNNSNYIESYALNGIMQGDKMILPVLVVPNALSVDPELLKQAEGQYLFRLKYLAKGIENIEDSATVPSLYEETKDIMVKKIRTDRGDFIAPKR